MIGCFRELPAVARFCSGMRRAIVIFYFMAKTCSLFPIAFWASGFAELASDRQYARRRDLCDEAPRSLADTLARVEDRASNAERHDAAAREDG